MLTHFKSSDPMLHAHRSAYPIYGCIKLPKDCISRFEVFIVISDSKEPLKHESYEHPAYGLYAPKKAALRKNIYKYSYH
jgi:hypothetical protein